MRRYKNMGMSPYSKRVMSRSLKLMFLSLPLVILFNNCQPYNYNQDPNEESQPPSNDPNSSDYNGHGYSGKVSFLSYDLVADTDSSNALHPEKQLVVDSKTGEIHLINPADPQRSALIVDSQKIRKLSPGNPYYLELGGQFYFREGFKLYQGSDYNDLQYRTPILALCQSNSVSAQEAGVSNIDIVIAAFVKPQDSDVLNEDTTFITHVVVEKLNNPTQMEYDKSLIKLF